MKIDTNFFGDESEWINQGFFEGHKVAPNLINEKYLLNELMNDTLTVAVPSNVSDRQFLNYLYVVDGDVPEKPQETYFSEFVNLIIFNNSWGGNGFDVINQEVGTTGNGTNSQSKWGYGQSEKFSLYGDLYPLLKFDYSSTILCIILQVWNNELSSNKIVSLSDYINNVNLVKDNYPIISGYGCDVYAKQTESATTRVVLSNEIYSIANNNPFHAIEGKNENEFINYYWNNSSICVGGTFNKYPYFATNKQVMCFYGNPENWEQHNYIVGNYRYFVPKYVGTFENIYSQVAYLGLWFTDNENSAKNSVLGENCTDDRVFLPIINETGVTKGAYRSGKNVKKLPNSTWTNIYEQNGYSGIDNIDTNTYTDKVDFKNPTISGADAFNSFYILNKNQLNNLADELYTADETKFQEILKGLSYFGENPLDCLISLRLYPFDLEQLVNSSTVQNIQLGRVALDTTANKVQGFNQIIDLGTVKFPRFFNNFLDYEPFTTAELYVPFVSKIPISCSDFLGKKLNVKMCIDFITGNCMCIVSADGIPIIFQNGVIATDIPITAVDVSTNLNNLINGVSKVGADVVGGVSANNVIDKTSNLIKGVGDTVSTVTDIAFNRTKYDTTSATNSVAFCSPMTPYFIIYLPNSDEKGQYKHQNGYACNYYAKIENLNGFTVCAIADLSNVSATETEKTMINNFLQGGIYV